MPELVEAECARLLCERLVGKLIEEVWVEDRDFKVFSFPSPSVAGDHKSFVSYLTGSKITGTARKGKQLVMHVSKEGSPPAHLFLQLGMSGTVCIEGQKHDRYPSFDVVYDSTWPPSYAKLMLKCSGIRSALSALCHPLHESCGGMSCADDKDIQEPRECMPCWLQQAWRLGEVY